MSRSRIRQLLMTGAAWSVGAIFLYAGATKAADPAAFAQAIANYRLLPSLGVNPLAILLPWLEIAAGLAWLLPSWRRSGAWITAALSCIFLAAVLLAWGRGLDIDCGCFGGQGHKAGVLNLVLDGYLIAVAWYWLYRDSEVGGAGSGSI